MRVFNRTGVFLFVLIIVITVFADARRAKRIALVDINLANVSSFTQLPGINRKLAVKIIEYRDKTGYFANIPELKNIDGISGEVYDKIYPYLKITPARELKIETYLDLLDDLQERESADLIDDIDIGTIEKYIGNPLDINSATISQLIELPGIDRPIANNIVNYRKKYKRYGRVEDVKNVIPDALFEIIKPYIAVYRIEELEDFHGDIRFRYGVYPYPLSDNYFELDSKYHNPQYFYNRLRIYYGNKLEFGIVTRKDRKSLGLDYENFRNYFLIKNYLLMRNVFSFDTLVLGNYSLDFGQGIFIQPSPFLIRRIPRKPRGLKEDKGTHYNEKFYGVAASKRYSSTEIFLFYSNKPLIVDMLNPDGSVATPPTVFYDYFITTLDGSSNSGLKHYEFFGKLTETLYGARIKRYVTHNLAIGGGYYEEEFSPIIDPAVMASSGDSAVHTYLLSDYYFRGDKVRLFAIDTEYSFNNFKLLIDIGRSYYHTFKRTEAFIDEFVTESRDWKWKYGEAYEVLGVFDFEKFSLWVNYHWIDYDYFAFHSSPLLTGLVDREEVFVRNEVGYLIGGKYRMNKIETELAFKYGRPMINIGQFVAKDKYEIYWDNTWKPLRKFTVRYRNTLRILSRTAASGEPADIRNALTGSDGTFAHIPYKSLKHRFELIHEPSGIVRTKWRLETVDNFYEDINKNMFGYMTFAELKYKPTSSLSVSTRVTYWDAPRGVSAGAMEYTWPNALIPFSFYSTYGASDKNYRYYIMPTLKFSRNSKLWFKYEFWPKFDRAFKNVFKLQYECSW